MRLAVGESVVKETGLESLVTGPPGAQVESQSHFTPKLLSFFLFMTLSGLLRTELSHIVCTPVALIRMYFAASNRTIL